MPGVWCLPVSLHVFAFLDLCSRMMKSSRPFEVPERSGASRLRSQPPSDFRPAIGVVSVLYAPVVARMLRRDTL